MRAILFIAGIIFLASDNVMLGGVCIAAAIYFDD